MIEKTEETNKTEEAMEKDVGPISNSTEETLGVETGTHDQYNEEGAIDTNDFSALFEESLRTINEGDVVKGEIVHVDNEFVLVDIGFKSEGQIRASEFVDTKGDLIAKVGAEVEVLVVRKEDEDGRIILSKEKAAKIKVWDQIKDIYHSKGTIKGKITSRVKGGLSVDIGVFAFLPGSQIDLWPVRDMDTFIGTDHHFKIVKYDKRQGNIVLSRRALLEEERMALREKTLEQLEEGAVVKGAVKNITHYGLFVDLGGIDGLVHITDMSWGRVGHPSEMHQIGDDVEVKILSFDREKERVSLGMKQLTPDPWLAIEEQYPVGTKIRGRVVSLKDYGAFIEIEQGVEGLVHVSEMSWTKKIRHPSQILDVSDEVEVVVLKTDIGKKRLSLGIKQAEPNPWDIIAEKYPVGTTIEGVIKNIADFGIFIGIDEGIDGLVHISDLSWTKRIRHPSDLFEKGQEVQAVVLNIDKDNERFSLGIKQLTPDPWEEIPRRYSPNTQVSGKVTSTTDFGVFIELEEGIEGLVHVSELPKEGDGKPLEQYQVGEVVEARVIHVSRDEERIGLSIRKLDQPIEESTYDSYLNNKEEARSNLGELLKEELLNLGSQGPDSVK